MMNKNIKKVYNNSTISLEEEINIINKNYNYKINVYINSIYIVSKYDEWNAYRLDNGKVFLYHKNIVSKNGKLKDHLQGKLTNFEQALDRIKQHDDYREKNLYRLSGHLSFSLKNVTNL